MNYEYSVLALISIQTHVIFTILYYSLYIVYSTNNPQVLYISDITYIYWLSVSLSACSSVVNGLGQSDWLNAAEPQVDAAQVNGAEMKVSHLSQFTFTNSVHPARVCVKSYSLQLCINIGGIIRSTSIQPLSTAYPKSGDIPFPGHIG